MLYMIIDCVLTACDLNPLYSDFIPIFIKAWAKLYPSIVIKIILIHPEIPESLEAYAEHIICFPPIEGVPTNLTSQYIRLLYPALLDCKGSVLITDMDMIPMNAMYFTRSIEQLDGRTFVSYRNPIVGRALLSSYRQIAMCYCAAAPSTWSNIFNITSIDDVVAAIKTALGLRLGWCTDQRDLYRKVTNWHARTRRFVCLTVKQTGHRRLDRIMPILHQKQLTQRLSYLIRQGHYSDYHMCRPYAEFKKLNDAILHFLPTSTI